MEVPIRIDGREAGRLRETRDGLYTVLEAELKGEWTGLVRLWVYGGGACAYLGVMQPWSGGLWLRRKLTRQERNALPKMIEYAANTAGDLHNTIDITKKDKHKTVDINKNSLHNKERNDDEEQEIKEEESLHKNESDLRACPWPAEPETEGLLWYRRGDGSLTAFDGVSNLLALPADLRHADTRAVEREIEGRRYLVFRF